MNPLGIAFTAIDGALLLVLPRRLAALPLLLGASYMTEGQVLEVGPAHFTVLRLLIALGLLRIALRGEAPAHGVQPLDRLFVAWAALLLLSSAAHQDGALVARAGQVWTELGGYLLLRSLLCDADDVRRAFAFLCASLVPLALLMLLERATGENPFGSLGGVNALSAVRHGHVRASGPFAHAILAGGVGALLLGAAIALRRSRPGLALVGLGVGLVMLYTSSSSGPWLMAGAIVLALLGWPLRARVAWLPWLLLALAVALQLAMNDPFYFVMAKVDLAGGSQSWFRAELIRSSIEHLDEWWAFGTDRTRHWMASGIPANDEHTDITNQFLMMGVQGGLPLMALFVLALRTAFRSVGRLLQGAALRPTEDVFLAWSLGALLSGWVVDFFGISLFDQSVLFFVLVLAAIAAVAPPAAAPASADRRSQRRALASPPAGAR